MDKKFLVKYVSSFVIGDGCLALAGNRNNNARYHLTQIAIHRDYVEWQANILENLCGVTIRSIEPYTDKNGWNHQAALSLQTKSLPFFTTLHDRWYLDGHKVLSPHDIKLFDAESLAILYMDDGSLIKHNGRNKDGYGIMLCTQSFSWADNNLLRDFIAARFNIHFTIRKTPYKSGMKYALYCTKQQVPAFIQLVKPYILPSFFYKIELPYEQPLVIG